ncbi:MAG: protein kinase, partial [Verrucomicrobia bacterium]|nr:protein kinase [Verrucomicrobiota bacterium]
MRAISICHNCGDKIFHDAPKGLCPACLVDTAIGLLANESVAAGDHCGSAPRPGETLGDLGEYELLEEIGRGAQGVVYRARQKSLNRVVALKVIGLGHWAAKAHIKRFRLEAEAAASLDHPFIVPIHEIGESKGSCYFSMQLVEGGQLNQVLRGGPMGKRQAAELIAKLARTVHYAHEHGILHRDIKPGNILIDATGEPHLTDFGLARLVEADSTITGTTEALGTPSYMAPEQARGATEQLTSATDVYGLGAVLYQLLTGHPPFAGGTTYETIRLLLQTEPKQPRLLNAKIDRDLSTICLKCLEKDPQRRYSSALALADDLERWLKREPIQARHAGILVRANKWMRREPLTAALIASLVALAAAVGTLVWKSELIQRTTTTGIAVLPFENLSNDREDASFADGVQDDILTKLAKISGLKVISRTSVMEYRGRQNTREIGKALGVSHVLEGSVRKTGGRLHINAQLIDARTDAHVWAEQYNCALKEMFTIQGRIAQEIAQQLHTKISPAERLAIERPPTDDLAAYDLYARAKNLLLVTSFGSSARANLLQAADFLSRAVANDPSFFQAYCQLTHVHQEIYFHGHDHTPARLALAEAAVQKALRIRPDGGEAHLARAENLYRGYLDYDGALAELQLASQTLPNDPQVFELKGYIERRRGKHQEALHDLERAVDLDPRNVFTLQQIAISYETLRRYAEAKSVLDRVLAIEPNDVVAKVGRALLEFDWKADTRPLHHLISEIRATDPGSLGSAADTWLICALCERDAISARNALSALGDTPLSDDTVQFSRPFIEGLIARMLKDDDAARLAFNAARVMEEQKIPAQPNY